MWLAGACSVSFFILCDSKGYAAETARLASALDNCAALDCLPPSMASCSPSLSPTTLPLPLRLRRRGIGISAFSTIARTLLRMARTSARSATAWSRSLRWLSLRLRSWLSNRLRPGAEAA